jgi:hypothetical protein
MQATQSRATPARVPARSAKSSIEQISDGLARLGHGPSDITDKIIKVAQALCALPGVEPAAAMLEALAMVERLNPALAPKPKAAEGLKTRDDLSFTRRDAGRIVNWAPPVHAHWNRGEDAGQSMFVEVTTLAASSEHQAACAIRFALAAWGAGTGVQHGFAAAVTDAAMDGLRARALGMRPFNLHSVDPCHAPA